MLQSALGRNVVRTKVLGCVTIVHCDNDRYCLNKIWFCQLKLEAFPYESSASVQLLLL